MPYGIYDVANNEGWVNVGDNAEFVVNSIRRGGTRWAGLGSLTPTVC